MNKLARACRRAFRDGMLEYAVHPLAAPHSLHVALVPALPRFRQKLQLKLQPVSIVMMLLSYFYVLRNFDYARPAAGGVFGYS